jgi:hypothetical protein
VEPEAKDQQAKPKRAQVPDTPEYMIAPENELTPADQRRNHQLHREEVELPEMKRQVEKENGKNRSS